MPERSLTLISAELSCALLCALLCALTGAFALGALAPALGLGAVFAFLLPERCPPGGDAQRKPFPRSRGRAAGRE